MVTQSAREGERWTPFPTIGWSEGYELGLAKVCSFFFFSAFPPFFQFFFSVVYLSWIQIVIKQNVIGEPKNLRSYPVLDPIGHFGVLHVVWTCRRWANVPGMARLYSIYCFVCFVSFQLTRIMYCRMFLQIIKKWDNQPTFMNLGWHALCLNMIWYSLFI